MSLEVVSTIFWCHCSHIAITAVVLLLLLLLYYCYFHITPVASAFPGAAELTTHLSRLINILWLPLCRINKFGFYFPRRLLRSPILVGHQSFTPKFHQSYKSLWGNKRGRTMEEIHTRLQDLDPKMFPSLRGEIDWWGL